MTLSEIELVKPPRDEPAQSCAASVHNFIRISCVKHAGLCMWYSRPAACSMSLPNNKCFEFIGKLPSTLIELSWLRTKKSRLGLSSSPADHGRAVRIIMASLLGRAGHKHAANGLLKASFVQASAHDWRQSSAHVCFTRARETTHAPVPGERYPSPAFLGARHVTGPQLSSVQ